MGSMYQVRHPSRSETVTVRAHHHHLRCWGQPSSDTPPLWLLHGWMDVSASWQFVVDALASSRWVIAPDWRGFGQTRPVHPQPQDHYVFADYLADLDFLIDAVNLAAGRASDAPVDLAGHSMGGNVAMVYAGVRPQRVRRLINLEGFGMPPSRPAQAAGRYARWMDELKALHRGDMALQGYDSADGVAARLMKTNRRLAPERALWLAQHWAAPDSNGRWHIQGAAAHKVISAHLYHVDEVLDIYARIRAPLLAVEAADDSLAQWYRHGEHTLAAHHERLARVPNYRIEVVADAGHMLHHDQPEVVARLMEAHLA